MQERENNHTSKSMIFLFGIFAAIVVVFSSVIISFVYRESLVKAYNSLFFAASACITVVILLYSFFKKEELFSTPQKLVGECLLFVAPGIVLLLTEDYINFPFWMFGGMLIACLIDVNLGMYVSYFYMLQSAHLQNNTLKGIVILLVVGTAACILVHFLKDITSMLYSMVTIACLTLVSSLVVNKLVIKDSISTVSFNIIITFLILIFVSFVIKKFLGNGLEAIQIVPAEEQDEDAAKGFTYLNQVASETNEEIVITEEKAAETTDEIVEAVSKSLEKAISELPQTDESILPYCDENSELLLMLKESKKTAYLHSLRVARLASKCADGIEKVDGSLVKAAALYHEIGKIRAGEVYNNTIDIAIEENFPDRLVDCLKSCAKHNAESISSVEAAIIIIADTVVTTFYFLKSTNAAIFPEKLVDSVIGKKVTQGCLNSSGLSIRDCNYIREYFVDTINRLEKK